VREFVSANPTVYLSTHAPLGVENLESRRVVDLDNPPVARRVAGARRLSSATCTPG
jgi:hypothetical protein